MRWRKLGLIYCPDGSMWWARSHAMIPTPVDLGNGTVRVFISCCDEKTIGRIGYVDLSCSNLLGIREVSPEPVLNDPLDGSFDDNGSLVCSVISNHPNGMSKLYYAGFELCDKIRYRIFTGLACSSDGSHFHRYSNAPVLDRSDRELFFRCGPFATFEDSKYKMWYVGGSGWEQVGESKKPIYDIRYAESPDGICWPEEGRVCISIENENEHGFGRPYVVRDGDLYRMFYSVRRRDLQSYRLGYAESPDGIRWDRMDDRINLDVSDSGWDSEMICYSAVIQLHGKWYMFYNGNDFGRTGFGVAELESW